MEPFFQAIVFDFSFFERAFLTFFTLPTSGGLSKHRSENLDPFFVMVKPVQFYKLGNPVMSFLLTVTITCNLRF